jgi:hypothetical protein
LFTQLLKIDYVKRDASINFLPGFPENPGFEPAKKENILGYCGKS